MAGWDDPRMPTLAGLRRRGVPPQALRDFCGRIGITKSAAVIEMQVLENCVRDELNETVLLGALIDKKDAELIIILIHF